MVASVDMAVVANAIAVAVADVVGTVVIVVVVVVCGVVVVVVVVICCC